LPRILGERAGATSAKGCGLIKEVRIADATWQSVDEV
jgi:hypothetical protein